MDAKVKAGKPPCTHPSISPEQLMTNFKDDAACKTLLRDLRWPDGVACPRCNRSEKVYALKARPFHWTCCNVDCGGRKGYRFSVITKTIFENTNYPLHVWFQVISLMTQSKKGISALQIHRQIKSGDYRTAWYMCQRIRAAMKDEGFQKLLGQVEIDETYIGGEDANRHASKRRHVHGTGDKTPIIGAISRKGNITYQMIERADAPTLDGFVRKVADKKRSIWSQPMSTPVT